MNKLIIVTDLAIALSAMAGCPKQTTKTDTAAEAAAPAASTAPAGSDQQAYETA